MGKKDDICSFLGYKTDEPMKDRRNLLKSISTFLADYEARGSKVYGKKAESIGGRLCAMNYLEEEGRGERFWPPTFDGSLVYEATRDKEIIIDHIADLFLIQARSNYSKLHAKRRSKKQHDTSPPSNVNSEHISDQPPISSVPEETYFEDEEPQLTYSSSVMTIEPELCLAPWLDPPRRFDRNVAIPWAESINPKSLPDPPVRLGRNWLSQENVRWPAAVDKEIQYFMHRWVFYYTINLENGMEDGIQSLVDLLRIDKGTSTELDGTQLREFRKRIMDRVKFFSETFINHQFIEVQADGIPQMTGRFRNVWTTLKYETPTPHSVHRSRSIEDETPRESPRKRRKLSKKEDNAMEGGRSKRKPWSEHAWRRKTIPPPADMTFPNLLPRKSSSIDSMTAVKSSQSAVDEEERERDVSEDYGIDNDIPEVLTRSSGVSVEIPPLHRPLSSKSNVVVKMEEEATMEVSQLGPASVGLQDNRYYSETIEVVPAAQAQATKTASLYTKYSSREDDPTLNLQNNIGAAETRPLLSLDLNDRSENYVSPKQPQLLDSSVATNETLEIIAKIVAANSQVNGVGHSQTDKNVSAPLLLRAEPQDQPAQDEKPALSSAINGAPTSIVKVSTQTLDLEQSKRPPMPSSLKSWSPTQVVGQTHELPRRSDSPLPRTIREKEDCSPSKFVATPVKSSSSNSQRFGPFHDLKYLHKIFSSSGSRGTDTHNSRNSASISPTSSVETHARKTDTECMPVNPTRNPVSLRTSPSIEFRSESEVHEKSTSQGGASIIDQPARDRPHISAQGQNSTHSPLANSDQISLPDAVERKHKPFEKSTPGFTRRTPLPTLPMKFSNENESTSSKASTRSCFMTMENYHKLPDQSLLRQPEKFIQNSPAPFCEPLIATFQAINRPTNGIASPPSRHSQSSSVGSPYPLPPLPVTPNFGISNHHPQNIPQGTRGQGQSQDDDQVRKRDETIPVQNVASEGAIAVQSTDFSWAKDPRLNPHPVNTHNGVYPMAFIKKPISSSNGVWAQGNTRKRALEGITTKPRKTKSRKKSDLPENPGTNSSIALSSPMQPIQTSKNVAPSPLQLESPRQPVPGLETSPKPPYPELINHLRIMDQSVGLNPEASYQPMVKTRSPLLSISNQRPNNDTETVNQNMVYQARQEKNLLNYLTLQEDMHSTRGRYAQDWENVKTTVGVRRATSGAAASSTNHQRTLSTPLIRPSISESPRISRSEHGKLEYGKQQNKESANFGHQERILHQNGVLEKQAQADLSGKAELGVQAGSAQGQVLPAFDNPNRTNTEPQNQPTDLPQPGRSEQLRPLQTELGHPRVLDSGMGSKASKSLVAASHNTSQHNGGSQSVQNHPYNHALPPNTTKQTNQYPNQELQSPNNHNQNLNNLSSPESYRSQDPWWNSLAANYNIKKISQPLSRLGSASITNNQQNRLATNDTHPTVQSTPKVQVGNQKPLPDMRQLASQVPKPSRSTSSQAYQVNFQNSESQNNHYDPTKSPNLQSQHTRSYSGNQHRAQPISIQPSNPAPQSVPPPSAMRASPISSNKAANQPSNGVVPSQIHRFHQHPSQSTNPPGAPHESQYTNDTSGQSHNTQTANYQHQSANRSPSQPSPSQDSVPRNNFPNQPAQYSPIQELYSQSQYPGTPAIQQASSTPNSYNSGNKEPQIQTASSFQYPKRLQHLTETHSSTMLTQQKLYNGQQPLHWTQYQLHDPRLETSMKSVNSSPRQVLAATTHQGVKTSPLQPSKISIPMTHSSPAPTMSTILNSNLPPTPPTPAIVPTSKLDSFSPYTPGNNALAGASTKQQKSVSRLETASHHLPGMHPTTAYDTRQQASAIASPPKLDTVNQYSPMTNPLATPQPTPTTPQAMGSKLDFFLQRSNSTIDTTTPFSYQSMEALSLSSLFSLFSTRSSVPLEKLNELTFRCMFGEYQQSVISKTDGDGEWKRTRKRIWRNWDREIRTARKIGEDDEEEFWEVNILIGRCV